MLEGMTAARLHELLAQKGCTSEECALLERLVATRRQMEAIERSMGCLKAGWGWQSAYDHLSRDEFLRRADALIAHHETRAATGERCLQQLRPLMAEATALSEGLATPRTESLDRTHDLAVLMRLIAQTNARYFGAIGDVYPQLIALERGHAQYFRQSKATGAAGIAQTLTGEPEGLAALERRIVARLHQNAAGRVDEAELYHALAPSAHTAARVTHVKVQAAFYAVLDQFNRLDAPPPPRSLQGLGHEVGAIASMVDDVASREDTRAAVPAVVARYEGVLKDLKCLEGALNAYATDVATRASEQRADLVTLICERTNALARVVDRVNTALEGIERMLR